MTFDDIPLRMKALGVDRAWLAQACRYSKSTLSNSLSKKGTNRNERALATMWEALDREEERQNAERHEGPFKTRHLLIDMSADEYRKWSQAQRKGGQDTLEDWAVATLNKATESSGISGYPRPTSPDDWDALLPKIVG